MSWDAAAIAQLRGLVDQGLSYAAIAARMGRTKNACVSKARSQGIAHLKASAGPGKATIAGDDPPCQWPEGEVGQPDFHFCNAPSLEGYPYCPSHCGQAYRLGRDAPWTPEAAAARARTARASTRDLVRSAGPSPRWGAGA